MPTTTLIVPIVAALGIFFGTRWLIAAAGCPCQFCNNMRTTPFAKLPKSTQETLVRFFDEFEHRHPNTKAIFVCEHCRTVFDDFSGERRSRDRDYLGSAFRPLVTCRSFCKVCNAIMLSCDPDNGNIHCVRCGTIHRWQTHASLGLRVLMAPPDAKVLSRCDDYSFGTA